MFRFLKRACRIVQKFLIFFTIASFPVFQTLFGFATIETMLDNTFIIMLQEPNIQNFLPFHAKCLKKDRET
jgi:hypothetical protein